MSRAAVAALLFVSSCDSCADSKPAFTKPADDGIDATASTEALGWEGRQYLRAMGAGAAFMNGEWSVEALRALFKTAS